MQDRHVYYIDSDSNIPNSSYFLINNPNLIRSNWRNTENGKTITVLVSKMNLLYNNGDIKIYNKGNG